MTKLSDRIRKWRKTVCSAVVVAGGSSRRMGEDKLFLDLEGIPVLARTLLALNGCECVDEIVLVSREDALEKCAQLCHDYSVSKVTKVVVGGKNRNESALAGLTQIRREAKIVLIHDGARPLVTEKVVRAVVHAGVLYKNAAPAVPVNDTIKEAEGDTVVRTLDRSRLSAIQTPQAFVPDLVKGALTAAVQNKKEYTDDCAAVEAMGVPTHLSEGDPENIKITRPVDLTLAAAILKRRGEHASNRTGV